MIISAFAAFVSSGGAPRASIAMGRGDYDQAQRILGGCFTLQVAISLVLTAVLLIWNRPLPEMPVCFFYIHCSAQRSKCATSSFSPSAGT